MNRTHLLRLAGLALVLAGAVLPSASRAEPVAIIVDKDNPRTDISASELRALLLGKRQEWPDGARAIPLDLDAGQPARDAVNRAVLDMEQADVDRYWVEQKVRGAAAAPKVAPTAASVVKLVARIRGAVAYVPASLVDGSVKVLTVGGIAPGKPGYPIQAR
jgi:hypothetical protein